MASIRYTLDLEDCPVPKQTTKVLVTINRSLETGLDGKWKATASFAVFGGVTFNDEQKQIIFQAAADAVCSLHNASYMNQVSVQEYTRKTIEYLSGGGTN